MKHSIFPHLRVGLGKSATSRLTRRAKILKNRDDITLSETQQNRFAIPSHESFELNVHPFTIIADRVSTVSESAVIHLPSAAIHFGHGHAIRDRASHVWQRRRPICGLDSSAESLVAVSVGAVLCGAGGYQLAASQ